MKLARLVLVWSVVGLACSPSGGSDGDQTSGGDGDLGSGGFPATGSGGQDGVVTGSGGQGEGSGSQPSSGGSGDVVTGSGGASLGSGGSDVSGSGGGIVTVDCSTMHRCDDFESSAAGAAPDAGKWKVELGYSNDQTTAANVQISAEEAHSGSNALKISNAMSGPYNIHAEPPAGAFFTRAWIKIVNSTNDENGSLMAIGSDHNSAEIRFRKHLGTATINSATGDGLSPDPFNCTNKCIPTPIGQWFCAEMFYDASTESATLWIDGVEAAKIENNAGWHSSSPGKFENPAKKAWFGTMWHQGSAPVTYIDDVAIHSARIGCE